MYVPYIHIPESTGRFYGLFSKRNGRLGDLKKNDTSPDLEMVTVMKKMAAYLKSQERNLDTHATCEINSCQGKATGVLYHSWESLLIDGQQTEGEH